VAGALPTPNPEFAAWLKAYDKRRSEANEARWHLHRRPRTEWDGPPPLPTPDTEGDRS